MSARLVVLIAGAFGVMAIFDSDWSEAVGWTALALPFVDTLRRIYADDDDDDDQGGGTPFKAKEAQA